MDRILQACARPTLAEGALYTYAKGGQDITGPSIRLAECMAQLWGNMAFGVRELDQRKGESTVQAFALDLETNTRAERVFQVPHIRHTRNGSYALTDPREVYEATANQGARRLRACILQLLPDDVKDAAVRQCEVTLATKFETTPEALAALVEAFGRFGVTREQIEARTQRRLESITSAQVVQLRKIYASLKDGMSAPADWFEQSAPAADAEAGESRVSSLKGKLRERREAAAKEDGRKPSTASEAAHEPTAPEQGGGAVAGKEADAPQGDLGLPAGDVDQETGEFIPLIDQLFDALKALPALQSPEREAELERVAALAATIQDEEERNAVVTEVGRVRASFSGGSPANGGRGGSGEHWRELRQLLERRLPWRGPGADPADALGRLRGRCGVGLQGVSGRRQPGGTRPRRGHCALGGQQAAPVQCRGLRLFAVGSSGAQEALMRALTITEAAAWLGGSDRQGCHRPHHRRAPCRGASPATVNRTLAVVRAILRRAFRDGDGSDLVASGELACDVWHPVGGPPGAGGLERHPHGAKVRALRPRASSVLCGLGAGAGGSPGSVSFPTDCVPRRRCRSFSLPFTDG